jgi:hypothetical protein
MNNETSEKKDSILKILAIAGFLGIIVLIAWASVQLVSVAPSAFSSLASLAESVNEAGNTDNQEREIGALVVTSDTLLANAGDAVAINWNTVDASGSYVFSYQCTDGVAIDLQNESGLQSIQCANNYNIGDVDSTTIIIDSEKNRYTDITYSVSFLGTNDTRPRAIGSATLTVLNDDMANEFAVNDEPQPDENNSDATTTPESQPTSSPTPPEPNVPTTPVIPEYIQEYTYAIPASNPAGKTDLAARYLFVGEIINNQFVPGAIIENESGAIQFEVKNFGTKTSSSWSFTVSLPGDGEYESATQLPLKPNERAILTVGFTGADVNSHTFEVEVDVTGDSNLNNNEFSHRVTFFD